MNEILKDQNEKNQSLLAENLSDNQLRDFYHAQNERLAVNGVYAVRNPHPDDDILGCGGILSKYKNKVSFKVVFIGEGSTCRFSSANSAEAFSLICAMCLPKLIAMKNGADVGNCWVSYWPTASYRNMQKTGRSADLMGKRSIISFSTRIPTMGLSSTV